MCEGDSGAWVAHYAAPEVYGHVVATDILGDAYVMPSVDTLQEIKECMGAKSVRLPLGGSIICAEAEAATISKSEATFISLQAQNDFRGGRAASIEPQIEVISETPVILPSVDCTEFEATSKSRNMDMQGFEPATNLPSISYPECKPPEHVVEQTRSGFDCSDDKTKDIISREAPRCEVDSSAKPQNVKSLTSPTPPLLRQRIGQGVASTESSASGRTPTLPPTMNRIGQNREWCYRDSYAKRWDPVFAKRQEFKEDWSRSYVQAKRAVGATYDGIELFFEDCERSVPDCKVEELREFCDDASLEDLKAGTCISGQQPSAWLDERSYPNRYISSQSRKHKNPLTATQLYERLNTPVSDPPCL